MAYTDQERRDIVEKICDRLMDGESLRKICQAEDMPNKTTVLKWLNSDEDGELATSIARARDYQADALDDDIQDITNQMLAGEIGHQEARVAIWAIQWRAGKLRPKRYGDKITQEQVGEGGGPIRTETKWQVEFVNPTPTE